MDALDTTDWIVGIGGIVLVISTFLGFVGYGTLWLLIGVAAVVLVCLEKFGNVDYPFEIGWLYLGMGALAALLGLIRLIQVLRFVGIIPIDWYIGFALALLAGLAIAVGGYLRARVY